MKFGRIEDFRKEISIWGGNGNDELTSEVLGLEYLRVIQIQMLND